MEFYYGDRTENEKIRIEIPQEENAPLGGYNQIGPTRMQLIIPIDGESVLLKYQGIDKIDVNGYFL